VHRIVTRSKACTYAARCGRLEATLQWLRDKTVHDPLPWDSSTLLAAARANTASSGECLDYAIDHGCPWTFAGRQWELEGQDPLFSVVRFVDKMVFCARMKRWMNKNRSDRLASSFDL
jgi:hypothetical protein